MSELPEDLIDQIRKIAVDRLFLSIAPEELIVDESLTDSYGIDSVRLFDMVVGLEDDFEISFADQELKIENFDTINDIAKKVAEKIGEI